MNTLLLDTGKASELRQHHVWVADAIDNHRSGLTPALFEAALLIQTSQDSINPTLFALTDGLRSTAQELSRRIAMVLFGGPDMNAGLWAVAQLQENFAIIESQNGTADGFTSKEDLQWAAEHLDDEAAQASQWLLDHPDFLKLLDAPGHNTHYLTSTGGYTDPFNLNTDGQISLADLQIFEDKVATYATIRPLLSFIDTAAQGGDNDDFVSKEDFEAFVRDNDLPPEVMTAVATVLEDQAFHERPWIDPEKLLFAAGLVPVLGDLIDGAFAMYYLSTGDYTMAAIYAVGLIPIPGVSGGAVRTAKETAEALQSLTAREARDYLVEEIVVNYVVGEFSASAADLTEDFTDNPYLIAATDRAASLGGGRLVGGPI